MAAGNWVLPNGARTSLINGTFDLDTDSWKVALVTSAGNVSASTTTWAGVTGEVGTTNTGYTTGGASVTLVLSGTTSVTVSFSSNPQWTAGSAGLTAKWAVLYKVGSNVLAYCLLDSGGADVTVTSGNTLTIDSDGSPSPVLTVA